MSAILKDALSSGLQEAVLPRLEAACREIFRQVNDVLESGVAQSFAGAVSQPLNAALDRLEEVKAGGLPAIPSHSPHFPDFTLLYARVCDARCALRLNCILTSI